MFRPLKPGNFIFKIYLARKLFINNNTTRNKRIAATRIRISNLIYNIIKKGYLRIIRSIINVL